MGRPKQGNAYCEIDPVTKLFVPKFSQTQWDTALSVYFTEGEKAASEASGIPINSVKQKLLKLGFYGLSDEKRMELRDKALTVRRQKVVGRLLSQVEKTLKLMNSPYKKMHVSPYGKDGPTVTEVEHPQPSPIEYERYGKTICHLIDKMRLELGEPNTPVVKVEAQNVTTNNTFALITENLSGIADATDRQRAIKGIAAALVAKVEDADVIEGEVAEIES